MKKAKLVMVSLMTRVVVEDNATEETILAKATTNFIDKLKNNEIGDNLEEIIDDEEMPFGED